VKVGNSQFLDGRTTVVNPVEFLVFEGKGREVKGKGLKECQEDLSDGLGCRQHVLMARSDVKVAKT
jgi:hypothetical protein